MAFTYGFYNSLNGDRRYKAEDFGTLVGSLITDGVFENVGNKLFVTAGTGMDINVGTGKAWFNNTWSVNDSVMVLTVPQSDITRPRYDTVVLEVNTDINVRENKIKIVSGSPQTTPTKPVLVNTDKIHQHPLAHILVPAAATSITASNIEIVVGQTACPFCTGILQATDITGLYNQWQADFNTWFQNIKNQLTGNVVTNLQAQIDVLKDRTTVTENKITTLQTTSNQLVSASNNTSDSGNIMLFGKGYNKTVTNALPCTGGSYYKSSYQVLFDRIGYTSGGSGAFQLVNLTGEPRSMQVVSILFGPLSGNIYRFGSTSSSNNDGYLHIFSSNGAFIREVVISTTNGIVSAKMTDDEFIVAVLNTYSMLYTSTDYGLTWNSKTVSSSYTAIYPNGKYMLITTTPYNNHYTLYSIRKSYPTTLQTIADTTGSPTLLTTNDKYFLLRLYDSSGNDTIVRLYNIETKAYNVLDMPLQDDYGSITSNRGVVQNEMLYWFNYKNMHSLSLISRAYSKTKLYYDTNLPQNRVVGQLDTYALDSFCSISSGSEIFYIMPANLQVSSPTENFGKLVISKMTNDMVSFLEASITLASPYRSNPTIISNYLYTYNGVGVYRIALDNLCFKVPDLRSDKYDAYIRT